MAFRVPGAGDLTKRVILEKRSEAPDATDNYAVTYTEVGRAFARTATLFGGRTLDGEQTDKRASHVFTIRWRGDARASAWDYLQFDGRRFRIHRVEDPDEGRRWLELLCEALGKV